MARLLVQVALAVAGTRALVTKPARTRVAARRIAPRMLLDAALLTTIGENAALPVIFVGSGTWLLSKKGGEAEDEEEEASKSAGVDGEVDLYRDTALRYAGYANEVGEAFKPLVDPWVVPASYGVAILYVLADTVDKTRKTLAGTKYIPGELNKCALIEGLDALLWQLTASVALPGYTIHQLVAIVVALCQTAGVQPGENPLLDVLPTALGLATIPFVVKPLDELAEELMDLTCRKLWEPYLESCEV